MRTTIYRYYMWRASRTDDFYLKWHYERKARKILK